MTIVEPIILIYIEKADMEMMQAEFGIVFWPAGYYIVFYIANSEVAFRGSQWVCTILLGTLPKFGIFVHYS